MQRQQEQLRPGGQSGGRWPVEVCSRRLHASRGRGRRATAPAAAQRLARRESGRRGSLLAMKCLQEPFVVGHAGMEQEWPGTGLAGKICTKLQSHTKKYAIISRNMDYLQFCIFICRIIQKYMQNYESNLHLYAT